MNSLFLFGSWCVYTHSRGGQVFYVGAGNMSRPYNKTNRSIKWKEYARGGYSVTIVAVFDSRDDALEHEAGLIAQLSPACNGFAGKLNGREKMNPGMVTYPLKLTTEELETLRRRAHEAGLSMQKYIKAILFDGKLPKRTK